MNRQFHIVIGGLVALLLLTAGCRTEGKRSGQQARAGKPDMAASGANRVDNSTPDSSQSASGSSMHFASTISSETPSGERLTFEATELVVPKSGLLSEALAKGTGQLLHVEGDRELLLSSGVVTSVSSSGLILEIPAHECQFKIDSKTIIGDGSRRFGWRELKLGDTVTVVSPVTEASLAQSIRRGALLLKVGRLNEASVPVGFECK